MNSQLVAKESAAPGRVRRFLDGLYLYSGRMAACFLVAICILVTLQVLGNFLDRLLLTFTGSQIGIVIPSYAEIAGFFLSAATFLALAYTLTSGDHIRVQLVLARMSPGWRRIFELWCCGAATVIVGTATAFTSNLVVESIDFGDALPGMIAIPLAIPQSIMALGLLILTIALLDCFCAVWRREQPSYDKKAGDE